jgi:hypothetical protein
LTGVKNLKRGTPRKEPRFSPKSRILYHKSAIGETRTESWFNTWEELGRKDRVFHVEHSIFKSPQGLLPLDPFDGLQFWQVVREQFFWVHCSTWNTPFLAAASRAALIDMSPGQPVCGKRAADHFVVPRGTSLFLRPQAGPA